MRFTITKVLLLTLLSPYVFAQEVTQEVGPVGPFEFKEEDIRILQMKKKVKEKEEIMRLNRMERSERLEVLQDRVSRLELEVKTELLKRDLKKLKTLPMYNYDFNYRGVVGNIVLLSDGPAVKTPAVLRDGAKFEVKNNNVYIGDVLVIPHIKINEVEPKVIAGSETLSPLSSPLKPEEGFTGFERPFTPPTRPTPVLPPPPPPPP